MAERVLSAVDLAHYNITIGGFSGETAGVRVGNATMSFSEQSPSPEKGGRPIFQLRIGRSGRFGRMPGHPAAEQHDRSNYDGARATNSFRRESAKR
jgi:hypothetical protein